MYRIKQSLDALNYGGYFHEGGALTMEQIIDRAVDFGYDAIDIWPHQPLMAPQDWDKKRRADFLMYAKSKGIFIACVDASTNFMRSDHVLVPRLEKELAYLKECCELAKDLACPIVRILPAFIGYFWGLHAGQGYGQTAMQSRTIEVSKQEDYMREWESVRTGIKAAALLAKEYGVILALQGHPPVIHCTEDLFDMHEEVGMDNLKLGIDSPLFEKQDDEFVFRTVNRAGKNMVHSHTLGVALRYGPTGEAFAAHEVVPGDGVENWIAFFKACKEIGYDGYFAYEQCAPFLLKGHKKPQIADIDERQKRGFEFIKSFEKQI